MKREITAAGFMGFSSFSLSLLVWGHQTSALMQSIVPWSLWHHAGVAALALGMVVGLGVFLLAYIGFRYRHIQRNFSLLIGVMYYRGWIFQQNYEKSARWCESASNAGCVKAINCLAYMCYRGEGVEQDHRRAFDLYEQAADAGSVEAIRRLAHMCYRGGEGVEQDYGRAFELYTQVADKGGVEAISHLAYMRYKGYGVEEDHEKARDLYIQAAEEGSVVSMFALGVIYYRGGINITPSVEQARTWLGEASQAGYAPATRFLEEHKELSGTGEEVTDDKLTEVLVQ